MTKENIQTEIGRQTETSQGYKKKGKNKLFPMENILPFISYKIKLSIKFI